MCIQDWQVGRLIAHQATAFTLTAGTSVTIPRNKNRVLLVIGHQGTNFGATTLSNVTCDGVPIASLTLIANIVVFTLETHGQLVTKEFIVTAQGATIAGGFHEGFMPEDMLAVPLESLLKPYSKY